MPKNELETCSLIPPCILFLINFTDIHKSIWRLTILPIEVVPCLERMRENLTYCNNKNENKKKIIEYKLEASKFIWAFMYKLDKTCCLHDTDYIHNQLRTNFLKTAIYKQHM